MHPKQVVHINKKYLKWIRKKPCLVCGKQWPNDAHHVWNSGGKNYGNDMLAVPLCRGCHTFGKEAYHNIGHSAFERFHNKDLKDEIINLLSEYIEEANV